MEVALNKFKLIICYDDSKQKGEELDNLKKERESLQNSILRREKLLANENYVAKAPQNIVLAERENLAKEKEKLELIEDRLNKLN